MSVSVATHIDYKHFGLGRTLALLPCTSQTIQMNELSAAAQGRYFSR
jgi:hypothetical protein